MRIRDLNHNFQITRREFFITKKGLYIKPHPLVTGMCHYIFFFSFFFFFFCINIAIIYRILYNWKYILTDSVCSQVSTSKKSFGHRKEYIGHLKKSFGHRKEYIGHLKKS
jgi:hypothetical protein